MGEVYYNEREISMTSAAHQGGAKAEAAASADGFPDRTAPKAGLSSSVRAHEGKDGDGYGFCTANYGVFSQLDRPFFCPFRFAGTAGAAFFGACGAPGLGEFLSFVAAELFGT